MRNKAHERFVTLKGATEWPEAAKPGAAGKPEKGLVFVDGFFRPELSVVPEQIVCLPMERALSSYGLFLNTRWNKQLPETDVYTAANMAFSSGVFVYVPPNVRLKLHVIHVHTNGLASPRIQLNVGKHAAISLVQTDVGPSNAVLDVALEAGSSCELLDATSGYFSLLATVKQNASLKCLHTTRSSSRFSAKVQLLEEGSSALVRALGILDQTSVAEVRTLIEHIAPHCTSRQHIKMALQGQSKSRFEGKILVRPEAQKTEAYQINNNLLLSDTAAARTEPNLEIFADDVKASHGATVTQLQDEELFYLRSRGLTAQAAKRLLTEGFCRELIDEISDETVRSSLVEAMHALS
jgi:Fe-S cluster assembly protein SufD